MQSPVKKIFITQGFGENAAAYVKFGYKGHNGIDYRAFLPNGDRCSVGDKSEVFAPHDGVIKENALDSNGYGNYIKIENDKEGSVLGHFSSRSPLAIGSIIKMGELVGYQGTTGNSSGIHLHWGYYQLPRDRNNGYGGFINQEGLYIPYGEIMSDKIELDKVTFERLVKNSTAYDALVAEGISQPQDIQKMRDTTNEYRTQMEKAQQEAKACRDELTLMKQEVAGKLGSTQDLPRILGEIDEIVSTMEQLTRKAKDSDEAIRQYEVQVTDLKAEVARLQLLLRANNSLSQASMYDMLLELFNRLVRILKVS
jgi:hypothetical protein